MKVVERFRDPRFSVSLGLAVLALLIASPAWGAGYSCAPCDFDSDGDVDQEDFGHLQGCLSGAGVPQTDPNCIGADLDKDTDVDQEDLSGLRDCLSGPNVPFEASNLVINEFLADNQTIIEDPDEPGEYPDWIELYNADATAVDLGGMYLTDDLTNPTKWQIPPGVSIDPGGYRIFWADEDEEQGDTHTNFKLDKEGEEIGLFDLDGATQIDSIVFGQQYGDVSYGRYPDGIDDWGFFATPTPDAANGPHDGP